MELESYLPIWSKLTPQERDLITRTASERTVEAGTFLHDGSVDCPGLMIIVSGQLRVYSLSGEGREVTLYRLFERDVCLMSASCVMRDIQFELFITAEKQARLWVIPPYVYKSLMESSVAMAGFTNQLMAARFSEVMWLMEQVMWKSLDKRLAAFLLEECALESNVILHITHEKIANHLGTAREVVTRMLQYFQSEEMVSLNRGTVTLTNTKKLQTLSK